MTSKIVHYNFIIYLYYFTVILSYFTSSTKNTIYLNLYFSSLSIVKTVSQNHFKLKLGTRYINGYINEKNGTATNGVCLLRKLYYFFSMLKSANYFQILPKTTSKLCRCYTWSTFQCKFFP